MLGTGPPAPVQTTITWALQPCTVLPTFGRCRLDGLVEGYPLGQRRRVNHHICPLLPQEVGLFLCSAGRARHGKTADTSVGVPIHTYVHTWTGHSPYTTGR